MPNSLMPSAKLRSANLPFFYVFGMTWLGIEPRPPAHRADALTTVLCGGGLVKVDWHGYRSLTFLYFILVCLDGDCAPQKALFA